MSSASHELRSNLDSSDQSTAFPFTQRLQKILKSHAGFNLFFISLGLLELLCCLIFYNNLTRSSLLAATLAAFITTLFSYFILRIYYQSKRPDELKKLCYAASKALQEKSRSQSSDVQASLWLANAYCRQAHELKDLEYDLYKPQKRATSLNYTLEKFGCWMHFREVHQLKEWFYEQAIGLYIELIKKEPNNLQFHIALANTYLLLSALYAPANKEANPDEERWIHPDRFTKEMHLKFTLCAKRTIEEFKILNDYSPNDPWIYTQLAYSYHDLKMPSEEIKAYEKILEISPSDLDALYRLGVLYFQTGQTSSGLKVYEDLKSRRPQKAEHLISYYGDTIEEVLEEV